MEEPQLEPQVYDGRYNRVVPLNQEAKKSPMHDNQPMSISNKEQVIPEKRKDSMAAEPKHTDVLFGMVDNIVKNAKEQIESTASSEEATLIATHNIESPINSIITEMLCGLVTQALEEIVEVLNKIKKPARVKQSYSEVAKKIKGAIKIINPANSFLEKPTLGNTDISDHVCELAFKAAQELDPDTARARLCLSTKKKLRCRMEALAGLCLLYGKSQERPNYELLISLLHQARRTQPSEYSTSFLEVIQDAMEGIFDPSLSDEISRISKGLPPKAVKPEVSKHRKKAQVLQTTEVKEAVDEPKKDSSKREDCSTCLLLKPHPYVLGNKNMKQWLHLYYQITELTDAELCKFDIAKAIHPIQIPTYRQKVRLDEYLKAMIPGLVDNIVRIRLKEERNKLLKKSLPHLCSHRPEQQAKLWLSTKGCMNPSFSAIVFPDDPDRSFKSPVMLFNEDQVFKWIYHLTAKNIPGASEPIRHYDFFASPESMRASRPIVSSSKVHKLTIHSLGTSTRSCVSQLHEEKMWYDPQLPLFVGACSLRDLPILEDFS
jgi:hypothetical protein